MEENIESDIEIIQNQDLLIEDLNIPTYLDYKFNFEGTKLYVLSTDSIFYIDLTSKTYTSSFVNFEKNKIKSLAYGNMGVAVCFATKENIEMKIYDDNLLPIKELNIDSDSETDFMDTYQYYFFKTDRELLIQAYSGSLFKVNLSGDSIERMPSAKMNPLDGQYYSLRLCETKNYHQIEYCSFNEHGDTLFKVHHVSRWLIYGATVFSQKENDIFMTNIETKSIVKLNKNIHLGHYLNESHSISFIPPNRVVYSKLW